MKINGKEYLSPQEQLFENTKDIEELKQVIKPEYTTSASLTEASVSVALNTTNAPEGTTEGWLLTHDGLKFKITGGDETNLLLVFYANLKGEDGTNAIDDTTTSASKLWSSQKTNNEIANAKDKGIYFTTTQPTYDSGSGLYSLNEGHFENQNANIPIKAFDLLIYIDGNDKASEIYKVLSKTGDNWSLDKLGDIGGGKQLYRHHLRLYYNSGLVFRCSIINDNNTAFDLSTFKSYLNEKGFTSSTKALEGYGWLNSHDTEGVFYNTVTTQTAFTYNGIIVDYVNIDNINDTNIIPL